MLPYNAVGSIGTLRCLTVLVLVASLDLTVRGQGNPRCWKWHFTYDFCCNASFSEGNPECWDKHRYTYRHCCLTDEPLPPSTPVNPQASKQWRVVCGIDLGGWMVHELEFHGDKSCANPLRKWMRLLASGHRQGFQPNHAFDQWVEPTDEYFWYSDAAPHPGDAWLGLQFVRPKEVLCVRLWHNNIPQLPITLQRWEDDKGQWLDVQHWPAAQGGEWAVLLVDAPNEARSTQLEDGTRSEL